MLSFEDFPDVFSRWRTFDDVVRVRVHAMITHLSAGGLTVIRFATVYLTRSDLLLELRGD